MARPVDLQITDVRKICSAVLEALLWRLDEFQDAPRHYQYTVIAKTVCEVAQGFGCTGSDTELILSNVRQGLEELALRAKITSGIPGISLN